MAGAPIPSRSSSSSYAGNTKYNEYNKGALDAVGGKTAGMTMTVSTMQLGVCAATLIVLWVLSFNPIKLCGLQTPDRQKLPGTKFTDILKTIPVGFCAAAAHSASVFGLGGDRRGDPLFGQIVKAGEPVLSAIVNTIFYGKPPSLPKWCCLPIIVGGVASACWPTLAAFKGSENKKLMTDKDIKARYGGVGNQYAVTEILAFLISLPVMFYTEGDMWPKFLELLKTSKELQFNLAMSGLAFYLYNELATMTIKTTGAVTASVANTAKRVIVLIYMAAITGKALTDEQKIGAGVAIGGVLIYPFRYSASSAAKSAFVPGARDGVVVVGDERPVLRGHHVPR
ncbi:hypothetical protein JL722_7906 [Aureococcus anophagefferens]|nr:hypothetical protein JL722_7906 [Aureococcus anophagefferens]